MTQRRNAGLMQRNRGTKDTSSALESDHKIISSPDQNRDEDESTDKQTRLTLMEEVLLLGLKDKEVSIITVFDHLFLDSLVLGLHLPAFRDRPQISFLLCFHHTTSFFALFRNKPILTEREFCSGPA